MTANPPPFAYRTMTCRIVLAQLADLVAAQPLHLPASHHTAIGTGVVTDSRQLKPGEVFVALRGERFDGHIFLATAAERGALAAVVDQQWLQDRDRPTVPLPDGSMLPLLVVQDTLLAYQAIARWWRQQFDIPVVAITGSVGKTTTKELISAVLATQGPVLKTQANYNNEIGVPQTLLQINASHRFAVIEMGMRGPGEIALLTQIAQPTIAVITNVGTAHIGRLGSEQAIANAKCELLAELGADSVAVLNHDNLRLMQTAGQVWNGKIITYGLEGGDLQGALPDLHTLVVKGMPLPLPLPGRHNALNYLSALAVANLLHIDWTPLTHGLSLDLPQGRAQQYALTNDVMLLDETYNAGLESMLAALQLLKQTPGKRHIAVLGTMKELGDRSIELHRQVGATARQLQLDQLLILADEAESQAMATGAAPLQVDICSSHADVIARLQQILQPGDRVLLKASRAVGLDQVVAQLRQQLAPTSTNASA